MKSSILFSAIVMMYMFTSCSKDEMQAPSIYDKSTRNICNIVNLAAVPTPLAKSARDTTSGNPISIGFTVSAQVIKVGNAEHKNEWPK